MNSLKQIARDITVALGEEGFSSHQCEKLRIIRALLADVALGDEDVQMPQVWNYLLDEDEDVEIVMMDVVDDWCGDLYDDTLGDEGVIREQN